jgi:hypothetical protein
MRRKALNEIIHIAAQEGAAAETNFGCAMAENIMCIKTTKSGSDTGSTAMLAMTPPQPQPDIGFNHVSIGCGKDNPRR